VGHVWSHMSVNKKCLPLLSTYLFFLLQRSQSPAGVQTASLQSEVERMKPNFQKFKSSPFYAYYFYGLMSLRRSRSYLLE
jgi:hypothetical protein